MELKPGDLPHTSPQGESVLPTSFVKDTKEVKAMRGELRQGNPVFWYELLQNAIDYNNWPKGKPRIICGLADGQSVSVDEYIAKYRDINVLSVKVSNYIREEGLSPYDIAHIKHGGGEGTLGQHGRGLTVASALAVADNHCVSIEYTSTDKNGSWKGAGEMVRSGEDQKDPHFALRYKRYGSDENKELDKHMTTIVVNSPSKQLVDSLINLRRNFLPANSRYEFSRIGAEPGSRVLENIFTVGVRQLKKKGLFFSGDELRQLGMEVSLSQDTEPARVEIVSDELVGNNSVYKDNMYVGGLRLKFNSPERPVLNWSFYGFESAKTDSRVERSSDSSRVDGVPIEIVEMVLKKCNVPDVHLRILRSSISGSKCFEGKMDEHSFINGFTEEAKEALAKAWSDLLEELSLKGEDVLITGSAYMLDRARAESRQALLINSPGYLSALKNKIGIKTVEEEFEVDKKNDGDDLEYGDLEPVQVETSVKKSNEYHIKRAVHELLYCVAYNKLQFDRISHADDANSIRDGLHFISTRSRGFAGIKKFSDLDRHLLSASYNLALLSQVMETEKGKILQRGCWSGLTAYDGKNKTYFHLDNPNLQQEYALPEGSRLKLKARGKRIKDDSRDKIAYFSVVNYRSNLLFQKFVRQFMDVRGTYTKADGLFDSQAYLASDEHEWIESLNEQEKEEESLGALRRALLKRSPELLGIFGVEEDLAKGVGLSGVEDSLPSSREVVKEFPGKVLEGLKAAISPYGTYKFRGSTAHPYFYIENENTSNAREMDLAKGNVDADASISMGKVRQGLQPLPCPVGMEPKGYTVTGDLEIIIYKDSTNNRYFFSTDTPEAKGLKIFFGFADNSSNQSFAYDRLELFNLSQIRGKWAGLINKIKADQSISEAEKLAIIAKAWSNAFTYTSVHKEGDYASQINRASGNCYTATLGLHALARAVGLPSRTRGGAIGTLGKILRANHAWNQIFINGEWLDVEGQLASFINKNKVMASVPDSYSDILSDMPKGKAHIGAFLQHMGDNPIQASVTIGAGVGLTSLMGLGLSGIAEDSIKYAVDIGTRAFSNKSALPIALGISGLSGAFGVYLLIERLRNARIQGKAQGVQEERKRLLSEVQKVLKDAEDEAKKKLGS